MSFSATVECYVVESCIVREDPYAVLNPGLHAANAVRARRAPVTPVAVVHTVASIEYLTVVASEINVVGRCLVAHHQRPLDAQPERSQIAVAAGQTRSHRAPIAPSESHQSVNEYQYIGRSISNN